MPVLEYCEKVIGAESAEDVWALHTETMARYGFDRLLYGFTTFRTPTGFGSPDDFLIMSNHDPEYINAFLRDGLYFHAPMVRWAATHVGACSWRWLAEHIDTLTEREKKVVEFNRKFGVTAGYSISFPDASITRSGCSGNSSYPTTLPS